MRELNQKDWELINAYHDGELDDAERRELETRLQSEPHLEQALRSVAGVSASLGALRPALRTAAAAHGQTATAPPAKRNQRPARWLAGGAVAAAMALALALGSQHLVEPSVFDIHEELATQSYAVEGGDVRLVIAGRGIEAPDLSGANLTPVAVRQVDSGSVAHYVGRKGCRLSYFRGSFVTDAIKSPDSGQVAMWSTSDDIRHLIVATGMDQVKFDAIARYLKLVTRLQANEQVLASLADATANAERCVA